MLVADAEKYGKGDDHASGRRTACVSSLGPGNTMQLVLVAILVEHRTAVLVLVAVGKVVY